MLKNEAVLDEGSVLLPGKMPLKLAPHFGDLVPTVPHANPFNLPPGYHLNITTEAHVKSWGGDGIHVLFKSESGGILAARESKDGSGLLAVADGHVVILYDRARRHKRSYHLKPADVLSGHICVLQYSADSRYLYFTTSLQTAVQSYSLIESRLIEPWHSHPSPPTVVAISPTCHMRLSASARPPIIYLQILGRRNAPYLIRPNATSTAVSGAAFHPERPNTFLLAFQDGTLALYDVTRLAQAGNRPDIEAYEFGHFRHLHSATTRRFQCSGDDCSKQPPTGHEAVEYTPNLGQWGGSITGAAFVPGYRSRAVTVGTDGRCRMVDFEHGGTILRTWHVGSPATCLSVLSLERTSDSRKSQSQMATPTSKTAHGETFADSIILTVGRIDGKVMLFNAVGLLLIEKDVDAIGGGVVGLEWMRSRQDRRHAVKEMVDWTIDKRMELPTSNTKPRTNRVPLHTAKGVQFLSNSSRRAQLAVASTNSGAMRISPSVTGNTSDDSIGTVRRASYPKLKHSDISNSLAAHHGNSISFSAVKARRKFRARSCRRSRIHSNTFIERQSTDDSAREGDSGLKGRRTVRAVYPGLNSKMTSKRFTDPKQNSRRAESPPQGKPAKHGSKPWNTGRNPYRRMPGTFPDSESSLVITALSKSEKSGHALVEFPGDSKAKESSAGWTSVPSTSFGEVDDSAREPNPSDQAPVRASGPQAPEYIMASETDDNPWSTSDSSAKPGSPRKQQKSEPRRSSENPVDWAILPCQSNAALSSSEAASCKQHKEGGTKCKQSVELTGKGIKAGQSNPAGNGVRLVLMNGSAPSAGGEQASVSQPCAYTSPNSSQPSQSIHRDGIADEPSGHACLGACCPTVRAELAALKDDIQLLKAGLSRIETIMDRRRMISHPEKIVG